MKKRDRDQDMKGNDLSKRGVTCLQEDQIKMQEKPVILGVIAMKGRTVLYVDFLTAMWIPWLLVILVIVEM